MLPEPTFSFTIPSIHDDTPLDCRVYNPPHSILKPADTEPPWSPRGAIVAHPYAPLGGCYDDPVVSLAAAEISKKGFVVGTFNFRYGALSDGEASSQMIDSIAVVREPQRAGLAGRPNLKYRITSPSQHSLSTTLKAFGGTIFAKATMG